jgi:hypothetical protein
MAEGRAKHEASGLWHYVRAYGADSNGARMALAEEALRRHWTLDGESVRCRESRKGEW